MQSERRESGAQAIVAPDDHKFAAMLRTGKALVKKPQHGLIMVGNIRSQYVD